MNGKKDETGQVTHQREAWMADMFPTVLASIGAEIEGDALGLGVNLYSGKQTLIEQFGEEQIRQSLTGTSPYFTESFVLP